MTHREMMEFVQWTGTIPLNVPHSFANAPTRMAVGICLVCDREYLIGADCREAQSLGTCGRLACMENHHAV